jgi:2-polyprenyl-3-methyl-5-hydroxy-6-metoxy-1,4-benzoquinol methylase
MRPPMPSAKTKASEPFDEAYYERYYGSARTRVHSAAEVGRLCTAVVSFIDWWQYPLQTVLDVGAGVGHWRTWFEKHRPKVAYRSTEYSAHACRAYGHEQRDITKWRAKERYDLVVCQGVLPYLDDDGAARAIENLAAMTAGFLYLEAITKRDLREVCDAGKTDVKVYGRTGAWYRARLSKHYVEVGCGLWCRKDAGVLFYELEAR